jgi:hypothetical protein
MYSPLLKESLLLSVPFSYFPYLFVQWTKEKKINTFVLCFKKEHSETKQMITNTGRGKVTFMAESRDRDRSFYGQGPKTKKICWYGLVG